VSTEAGADLALLEGMVCNLGKGSWLDLRVIKNLSYTVADQHWYQLNPAQYVLFSTDQSLKRAHLAWQIQSNRTLLAHQRHEALTSYYLVARFACNPLIIAVIGLEANHSRAK
jgi:hypothetical protein